MKREFLAEHGFEVIDAHIHPFLENESANIAGFGSPASPDEFVAELKSLGIAKVCGAVILHKDCRMEAIREANRSPSGSRRENRDGIPISAFVRNLGVFSPHPMHPCSSKRPVHHPSGMAEMDVCRA